MLEARPDAPVPAPQTSPPFPLLCSGKTQKRGIRLQRHFRGNDSSPLPTILAKQPHSMPIPAAMETEGYDDLILAPRIDRSKSGSLRRFTLGLPTNLGFQPGNPGPVHTG